MTRVAPFLFTKRPINVYRGKIFPVHSSFRSTALRFRSLCPRDEVSELHVNISIVRRFALSSVEPLLSTAGRDQPGHEVSISEIFQRYCSILARSIVTCNVNVDNRNAINKQPGTVLLLDYLQVSLSFVKRCKLPFARSRGINFFFLPFSFFFTDQFTFDSRILMSVVPAIYYKLSLTSRRANSSRVFNQRRWNSISLPQLTT